MSMDYLIEHVRQGILLGLLLSLPPILAAAAIGLVIGILQAVTQVQEQTIAAVPKMIVVFLILIVGGATMLEVSGGYIRDSARLAFYILPKNGTFLLPPSEIMPGVQSPLEETRQGMAMVQMEKRQIENRQSLSRQNQSLENR
jgi:flagellar biosynthesis protein FliQ